LREWNAMSLIYAHQPSPNLESDLNAYSRAQERLLAAGVVAVQEAWIDRGMPEVYIEASRRGLLKLRVNLAVRITAEAWQEDLRFAKATRSAIRDVADPLLTANTVKVFVDGVFGSGTALSQSPYYDGHAAEPVWQIDELRRMALAADNAGFQLHFHAIGDQAVSIAVDTVEHLELCNGWVDRRPVIAHAELVSAADLTRIRRLGIVVCQQPIWATEGASVQQVRDLLGDSVAEQLYPIRTLLDAGIRVSFGSDWPVSDPEPLPGLYAAATRVQPSSLLPPLNASEAIPLPQALRSYSDEVAYQLGQDPMADRVILDTDLTTCSPAELLAANVVSVTIANKLVWQAN
jgi:predicted amidohydrolase YtcJ